MVKIISGILIFILGSFVLPAVFIFSLLARAESAQAFRAPGSLQIEATEPGRYILWNDYSVLFEGQRYHSTEELPNGMQFRVRTATGEELALTPDSSTSVSSGDDSSRSIGYVSVEHTPVSLIVEASGNDTPRILSFGQSQFAKYMASILIVSALSLLSFPLGIGLIIWGALQLSNNKQAQV